MHAPTKGLLFSISGSSDAPYCRLPPLLLVFCGFLIFCFVFLLCLLCCICFSFLVFLCCFVGYLGLSSDQLLCFILEIFVPKFRIVISSPMAPHGNAVPLQAGQLLGQLLQTPFVVPFLGFSTKIQRTLSFFWPISYYLLQCIFILGLLLGSLPLF